MSRTSRKPSRKYKDSGNEMFEVTRSYPIPRRDLKKVFDKGKADLLNDLSVDPLGERAIESARNLTFDKFLKELHSNFGIAAEMEEVDPTSFNSVAEWAESEFESWTLQP